MSRLLSVLITLFVLLLVYLWINHITNDEAEPRAVKVEASTESDPAAEEAVSESFTEVETLAEPKEDEPVAETVQPQTSDIKPEVPAETDGRHLVIAGNFLERANAEKHLRTVKELGYSDAEILVFEISEYYTVCAGRYEDLTSARKVSRELKTVHSIDSYVRHGN